jgi:hypothetical protein
VQPLKNTPRTIKTAAKKIFFIVKIRKKYNKSFLHQHFAFFYAKQKKCVKHKIGFATVKDLNIRSFYFLI